MFIQVARGYDSAGFTSLAYLLSDNHVNIVIIFTQHVQHMVVLVLGWGFFSAMFVVPGNEKTKLLLPVSGFH